VRWSQALPCGDDEYHKYEELDEELLLLQLATPRSSEHTRAPQAVVRVGVTTPPSPWRTLRWLWTGERR